MMKQNKNLSSNKKIIRYLLPILIIILTVIAVKVILENPPEAKKRKKETVKLIPIKTMLIQKRDFNISLQSYGLTQPSIQSVLSSQVSGKITYINKNFKNGAFIKKGETLLKIEDEEYKADLKIAQAQLIIAKQNFIEEEAQSKQAKEDWQKFNKNKKANSLVLRKPQLESARANLISAKANVEKAKLTLNRTKIIAPYNARVIEKNVSISQVVSSNTQLAVIYSYDAIEIRLPIRNKDFKYINLNKKNRVDFYSNLSNKTYAGEIVRSESSIDTNTKQLNLIAEIRSDVNSLKIGEYLKADILAEIIEQSIVIPNSSIYQGLYVYIEKDGIITKRDISIAWQDKKNSLILKGLEEKENLVTTTLGLISSGTKVKVINNTSSGKRKTKQRDIK